MDGLLVVDKPEGWTSHDVVARMRRIAKTKRIGHLGTLDPIATGVLPLLIGQGTRLAQFYTQSAKVYETVVRFGFSTDTYDRAGAPTSPITEPQLQRAELEDAIQRFRGPIRQMPPSHSAKKIGGVPAYRLARKQQPVDLAPVDVVVHKIEVRDVAGSRVTLHIHCSAGTYVRTIAHDLGQIFGCGAHVEQLRRTASGGFRIEQAHTLAALEKLDLAAVMIRAAELLSEFPIIVVDDVTAGQIRQGRDFHAMRPQAKFVKAVSQSGDLIAIGKVTLPNVFHPAVVLG